MGVGVGVDGDQPNSQLFHLRQVPEPHGLLGGLPEIVLEHEAVGVHLRRGTRQ